MMMMVVMMMIVMMMMMAMIPMEVTEEGITILVIGQLKYWVSPILVAVVGIVTVVVTDRVSLL
jgi:hypothetical protein